MPKVYVPHLITRYSPVKGCVVPSLDFTDALRFGDLSLILDDNYKSEFFEDAVSKIKSSLQHVTKEDLFIPTGEPAMIAICASVIVKNTGRLNILRWDRIRKQYFLSTSEV